MYRRFIFLVLMIGLALVFPQGRASAATYNIACEDITGLINAINAANASIANDVINLAGNCNYFLTAIHNTTGGMGGNGLPAIASASTAGSLTINGNRSSLYRNTSEVDFRIFFVQAGGNLTVNNVQIVGGISAQGNNFYGGGLLNYNGTVTLNYSEISSFADYGGGFYNISGGTVTLNSSTLYSNAAIQGGGFYNNGTVNLRNATLTYNSTGSSGNLSYGFYNNGTVNITNSTILDPSINLDTVTMNNTVTGGGCFWGGGTTSGSHNLIGEPASCPAPPTTNTLSLSNSIAQNFNFYEIVNDMPHYFRLLPGSPALDVGSNALVGGLTTDVRGSVYTRIFNGTVDIGAFEWQSPKIYIYDINISEGTGGTSTLTFSVLLTEPSSQQITVNYATANGSATAGSDYTAASGTLTFAPEETVKSINITINGDTTFEANETLVVNLSSPVNAGLLDQQGVGTITNDDTRPVIRVNDLARTEGASGVQTNLPFTVTLSNPSYQTITVQFATSDGTATTADSDYTGIGLTTLSFAPGVTSRNVTVKINGDAKHEPHETLNFNLSNPVNATIADNLGVGTIANDDSKPTISVNDVSRAEGNSGTTNFPFVVTLSHPSYQTITVNFATSNGTAAAGTDYTARNGSLSFAPGVTSRNITVVGNGDTLFEPNETFNFTLSAAANATIADGLGVGTITNDDASGLSEEGVQIVPVAPELPQFVPVAPVMPDAPVQPAQPTEAVPLLPAGAATGNPVMFMWRGATGATSYSLHITTEAGELVYEGVFSGAVDCAGEICQALPDAALTSGVNYLWSIQAEGQPRSFGMLFSYLPVNTSPVILP